MEIDWKSKKQLLILLHYLDYYLDEEMTTSYLYLDYWNIYYPRFILDKRNVFF